MKRVGNSSQSIIVTICTYILFSLLALKISAILRQKQDYMAVICEKNKIKFRDEVFTSLLTAKRQICPSPNTTNIYFGNNRANLIITIVSNPHCGPCGAMHTKIEELLDKYKENICVFYVFSSFEGDWFDESEEFLISVYFAHSKEITREIYADWYNGGRNNRDSFISKYSFVKNQEEVVKEMERHRAFCERESIEVTPTIFINGYMLPKDYSIDDLKYFDLSKICVLINNLSN